MWPWPPWLRIHDHSHGVPTPVSTPIISSDLCLRPIRFSSWCVVCPVRACDPGFGEKQGFPQPRHVCRAGWLAQFSIAFPMPCLVVPLLETSRKESCMQRVLNKVYLIIYKTSSHKDVIFHNESNDGN